MNERQAFLADEPQNVAGEVVVGVADPRHQRLAIPTYPNLRLSMSRPLPCGHQMSYMTSIPQPDSLIGGRVRGDKEPPFHRRP